jgi:cellulose biosynthesis protein BcsQ
MVAATSYISSPKVLIGGQVNNALSLDILTILVEETIDGLFRLRGILETVEPFYQYVVIDNPPGLSYLSINSLVGSTHVVIPCQLEAPSIEGLTSALKTIVTFT